MKQIFLPVFVLLVLLLFGPGSVLAQKASMADKFYEVYKKDGIDKAITFYKDSKKKKHDQYLFNQSQLNRVGYWLINEENYEAAKKVFSLNMQEYPNHPNPPDSYAELMMKMNNNDEAIKYFKRSLELINAYEDYSEADRYWYRSNIKSSLAWLEGKGRAFDKLAGNWNFEEVYDNQGEWVPLKGKMNFIPFSGGNAMVIDIAYPTYTKTLMITYNAISDEYESVASISSLRSVGIVVNKGKIVKIDNDVIEFQEVFTDIDDTKIYYYHRFKDITDKGFKWDVDRSDDGKNWIPIRKAVLKS